MEGEPLSDSLIVEGSKVWVHFEDSQTQGWDFGISDSSPVLLPNRSLERPHLHFIDGTKQWATGPPRIEDTVTGKEVFQLAGRYAEPTDAQWDGQYLVSGYSSREVIILDFDHLLPQ